MKVLKNDNSKRIVITNYSIFSLLTEDKVSGYSRWYPGDNSAYPVQGKYYENYKNFIVTFLKKRKIVSVYILPEVSEINFTNYVEKECFTKITK